VRYQSSAPPLLWRSCWCRTCQYLAAGNSSVNGLFRKDGFEVRGETRSYSSRADSGNLIHRSFCPACGTPMFAAADVRPQFLIVRVGTLDEPAAAVPAATIWVDSAPAWGCIDAALPRHPAAPPPIS
jgi:hypothetical protein